MKPIISILTMLLMLFLSCAKSDVEQQRADDSINQLLENGGKWLIVKYKVNDADCTQYITNKYADSIPLSKVYFRATLTDENLEIRNGTRIFYSKYKNQQISVVHSEEKCDCIGNGCLQLVFMPESISSNWVVESLNKTELRINCSLKRKYEMVLKPAL
ncbi:MAG: hypothetical protein IPM51_05030 [Sphingobacteriaceae bacterium]|nr:hypothetical protein [Sphingobacteriaceae bacterium]